MKRPRQNYSIRETTVKALRKYAEKTGFSMSHIVDVAVEKYIAEKEAQK